MFKKLIAGAALATALTSTTALAVPAQPVIDVPTVFADYFEQTTTSADLVFFDALAEGFGFATSGDLTADLSLTFNPSAPFTGADASFDIFENGGSTPVLTGLLSAISASEGIVTLGFTQLDGVYASIFGTAVAVELAFNDILSGNPLTQLTDGESYEVSLLIAEAPQVPLPAGFVLLASAGGLMMVLRRRTA